MRPIAEGIPHAGTAQLFDKLDGRVPVRQPRGQLTGHHTGGCPAASALLAAGTHAVFDQAIGMLSTPTDPDRG